MTPSRELYLFDGSSYVYRAFYALPPLKTKDGIPTGAVYGFLRMLFSFLKGKKPQYMAVVFDVPQTTFRSKSFSQYKAQRKPAPEGLKAQIPIIKKLLKLLGIPVLEKGGYEADDIIATLAKRFSQKGWKVYIYTPDKDMVQLLTYEGVFIVNPLSGEEITPEKVEKKFRVKPGSVASYLALVGDKVDNIPGVEGVGPKKAVEILKLYPTVEDIVKNWKNLNPKVKKYLSKSSPDELLKWFNLVKLEESVPLDLTEEDLKIGKPNLEGLKKELQKLEMKSLIKELEKLKEVGKPKQKSLF
jgi:DNA polymerase-1